MTQSDWNRLARALRELHRALVERARSDYLREHGIGGDVSPGELLRLLTTDPFFSWLRELSELMVDLDLIRDGKDPETTARSGAVRASVEYLLTPPTATQTASAFGERYWPYIQDDPHVAMAHGEVKRAIAKWPAASSDDGKSLLQHRIAVRERAHEHRRR